jgi:hypothetical protein
MASPKEYAYYLEGNKVGIVERDTAFDNDPNSKDYGPGTHRSVWKSPLSDVTDALEVKYTYAPTYRIESTDVSTATAESWDQDNDGNFRLRAASGTDWTSSPNLSAVTHIVLTNAGKFNGLHKVSLVQSTRIVTTTKISASTSATLFEETPTLYYDVSALQDESFELDLPLYLQKALVYYVKGKLAEDVAQIELKEYMMKEFRRMLEKYENSRISGLRIISSGANAIR